MRVTHLSLSDFRNYESAELNLVTGPNLFVGSNGQGKTNLVALLSKVLTEAGIELIVQRADPQIDDKLSLTVDQLKAKLAGKKVFLREVQAPF